MVLGVVALPCRHQLLYQHMLVLLQALSAAFVVCALITFRNVQTVLAPPPLEQDMVLSASAGMQLCHSSPTGSASDAVQAKKYTYNADAYDVNAVLAALFLGVVIVILFFVVSLVLLLKCVALPACCLSNYL